MNGLKVVKLLVDILFQFITRYFNTPGNLHKIISVLLNKGKNHWKINNYTFF